MRLFLFSLIIVSLIPGHYPLKKTHLVTLTTDQLSSYDLSTLNNDCSELQQFNTQLNEARVLYNNQSEVLQTGISTLQEAVNLINQIIEIENKKNTNNNSTTASLLSKTTKLHKSTKFGLRISGFISITKKEIVVCLDGINAAYNLVSDECRKNIDELKNIFIEIKEDNTDETPVQLCNKILDLVQQISTSFNESLNTLTETLLELNQKKIELDVLLQDNSC